MRTTNPTSIEMNKHTIVFSVNRKHMDEEGTRSSLVQTTKSGQYFPDMT